MAEYMQKVEKSQEELSAEMDCEFASTSGLAIMTAGGLARPRAWLVAQCQAASSPPGHVDFFFVR